ncbi:MAG TPA: glycosyltransferase family A protein, partial [Actinomycetes bacterium]|nr:glycosyltransferase family A protein [Actinomycetes bacterium]
MAEARLPSVSVVVPTRDRPELLRRAVAAILGQTYPGPVQCVVVFDQSDPDLPWADPGARRRLKLVRNQRTAGLAGARNSGVLHADGELVA